VSKPNQAEEASSQASSTTSSPYVAGAGPGFDAKTPPPEAPTAEETQAAFLEEWQEEQLRDWLRNAGALAHAGFGVGQHDWEFVQADLDRIAPPLTRIFNRWQPSRAAAAYSDPAAAGVGFFMYGWRSTVERTAVLKQRRDAEERAGAGSVTPHPTPQPESQTDEPTWADQLRATRPPEES
jgi:hypothetical protein